MWRLSQKDSELGRLFEEVSPQLAAMQVDAGEVLQKAFGATLGSLVQTPEVAGMIEAMEGEIVSIFRPVRSTRANDITIMLNGKPKVFIPIPKFIRPYKIWRLKM